MVPELSMGWVDPWVGLGWVGSHEMDPWTTLHGTVLYFHVLNRGLSGDSRRCDCRAADVVAGGRRVSDGADVVRC